MAGVSRHLLQHWSGPFWLYCSTARVAPLFNGCRVLFQCALVLSRKHAVWALSTCSLCVCRAPYPFKASLASIIAIARRQPLVACFYSILTTHRFQSDCEWTFQRCYFASTASRNRLTWASLTFNIREWNVNMTCFGIGHHQSRNLSINARQQMQPHWWQQICFPVHQSDKYVPMSH